MEGSELLLPWSSLQCSPLCPLACARPFFYKPISVIFLEENYFAGTILTHLNPMHLSEQHTEKGKPGVWLGTKQLRRGMGKLV